MNILHQAARRLERLEALDKVARPLTDLPIGAWAMSALDAAGGPGRRGAADLLVAVGAVAAVPTAAAGLND